MFVENKKKREDKRDGKQNATNTPAWKDKSLDQLQVSIEDVSRLRKLKKTEAETKINGSEYAQRLQDQYNKIVENSELFSWAAVKPQQIEDAQENEDEDPIARLLKSNTSIYSKRDIILKPEKLEFTKLMNPNNGHYHQSVASSVRFHPRENILLTAGLDRKAKLFQINTKRSQKIQSIFLPDLPIYTAQFILNGNQVLFSGNRKHFYYYDLPSNKIEKISGIMGHQNETNLTRMVTGTSDYFAIGSGESGYIMVMSQKSKKLLFELKMNGSCNSICFSNDERYLYAVGDQSDIYQWDLTNRKCINKISDEGSFNTTHIAMSPDGNQLATGSHSGIVNFYKINQSHTMDSSPIHSIPNLTTAITDIQFNTTGQLLSICSKWKKNAVKLVHIPSYTVYQNFPGGGEGVLKYPFTMDFSYSSEFFAMGNDEGKAHLWHLSHFSEAKTD